MQNSLSRWLFLCQKLLLLLTLPLDLFSWLPDFAWKSWLQSWRVCRCVYSLSVVSLVVPALFFSLPRLLWRKCRVTSFPFVPTAREEKKLRKSREKEEQFSPASLSVSLWPPSITIPCLCARVREAITQPWSARLWWWYTKTCLTHRDYEKED